MGRVYSAADWYWAVGDGPAGQLYASARFAYVPAADADFVAFLAGGDQPTTIESEALLRDELERFDVPFLALPLRPLEVARPRVHRARLRLRRVGQSLDSGTGAAIQWAAAGAIDPLGMWNAAQPDRVTIPAGQDGLYLASVALSFAASALGDRTLQLRRGAAAIPGATQRQRAPVSLTAELFGTRPVLLAGLDVVRVAAAQDSGGALLVDAELALVRIE